MVASALAHSRVRFGVFELDLQTGQLRKSGVLLHLPPQPFKVLTLLAGRPAELVTREEIRDQIWGTDTFVDFEHGLNFAIKKIRDTLGDDADTPRYIETLPRRGYRFIAPVEQGADAEPTLEPHEAGPTASAHPERENPRNRWIVAAIALSLAAIAAVLVGLNVSSLRDRLLASVHAKSAATPPKIESIAVLPLENLSRVPEQEYFADGLTDALITDLGQGRDSASDFANVGDALQGGQEASARDRARTRRGRRGGRHGAALRRPGTTSPHNCLRRGPTATCGPRLTSATLKTSSDWRNSRPWRSPRKSAGG